MLLGGFEKEIIKLTDLHARMQLVSTVRAYIAAAEDSKAEDFLQLSDTDQQKMLDVCQQHIDNVSEKMSVTKDKIKKNSALF